MVAAEENEKEVVSVENDSWEAEDVLLGTSVLLLLVLKSSKLWGSQNFRRPTSLNRSVVCVHARSNMRVVFLCFCNPPKYDRDYRIFNVPTRSFNACVYTRVCLYLSCKTEWLPLCVGGGGTWGPICHLGGPLGPLLWNPRSNTVNCGCFFCCFFLLVSFSLIA